MTREPPFLSQGSDSRRSRAAVRRRRRRRRAIALGTIALLLSAGAIVVWLTGYYGVHGSASASTRVGSRTYLRAPASPTRSPSGLPLGRPPLHLDLGGEDPVQMSFRHPPRAGLEIDLSDGRVLWQRNPLKRLPIASLTKMMTALRVVRSAPPGEPVPITRRAVDANGSKVGVLPLGRHVRLETMLYGLLLPSGNDAAIALAEAVSGSTSAFIAGMNVEAARLGMGCTRYSTVSGYRNAGNYSCAADLAELAEVDLQQPRIARIVRTYRAVVPFPIKGGKLYLSNNNPLLIYGYPGVTGLKTGYTELAGRCLVATATRRGVRLAVVLLNSRDPGTQARELLDRAFEDVYHQRPVAEPPMPPTE